jgi:malonyl-CoA O-methyltransferase
MRSVEKRFTAAAGTYDQHASVQERVADELMVLLGDVPAPEYVLEIGCGTGVLTTRLCAALPGVRIAAQDISSGMVSRARAKLGACVEQWYTAPLGEIHAVGRFDLAISSSTLHWMAPLEQTFATLSILMKPEGSFVFAMMVEGTLGELHACRLAVAPHKPVRSRLPTASQVQCALETAGFVVCRLNHSAEIIHYDTATDFLRSINAQGLTGGPYSQSWAPLTRGELLRLTREYDRCFRHEAGVRSTYQILYAVARLKT